MWYILNYDKLPNPACAEPIQSAIIKAGNQALLRKQLGDFGKVKGGIFKPL